MKESKMLEKKMVVLFMFTAFLLLQQQIHVGEGSLFDPNNGSGFIKTSGTQFFKNGAPLYFNGFNSYWLMLTASNPSTRGNVTSIFQEATKYGMNLARTWGFSDGGVTPLQTCPGTYNEDVFKGMDFVISEAGKNGIYLIISLVNNYNDYGGRKQYVQWARERGQQLSSDDEFYTNPIVKGYYKNHIQKMLWRKNSITGVTYKDDPTILAWELMNEPRCDSDLSGQVLQKWLQEMATYVKSIDCNHLLEIGLEGFYGQSKRDSNPHSYLYGTDFISNNQIAQIDFATIHAYPDAWLSGSDDQTQLQFVQKWLQDHIQDSSNILKKPLLFTEFGKSSKVSAFNISRRDAFFNTIYDNIYASAKEGGACNGAAFWQVLDKGMDMLRDGYEVIFQENPSTASIIARQSQKLLDLSRGKSS